MDNAEIKVKLLEYLIKKGFSYRLYKEQSNYFYTLIIDEPEFVRAKVFQHYGWELNDKDDVDLRNVKFLIEIMEDFSTAQWSFVDGLDDFYIFKSNEEFLDFVTELPDKIQVV